MLALLKLVTAIIVIAALAVVGMLGYEIYQGKTIPELLTKPPLHESFSPLNGGAGGDKVAPLVTQAQLFSLKINPPVIPDDNPTTVTPGENGPKKPELAQGHKSRILTFHDHRGRPA